MDASRAFPPGPAAPRVDEGPGCRRTRLCDAAALAANLRVGLARAPAGAAALEEAA